MFKITGNLHGIEGCMTEDRHQNFCERELSVHEFTFRHRFANWEVEIQIFKEIYS